MTAVNLVAWLVAAACLGAGLHNLMGTAAVRAGFMRFGYPPYWHWVTGVLEVVGAILLVVPATRLVGVGLLGAVLVVAMATIFWHRDFKPVVPCVVLLVGLAFVGLNAYAHS